MKRTGISLLLGTFLFFAIESGASDAPNDSPSTKTAETPLVPTIVPPSSEANHASFPSLERIRDGEKFQFRIKWGVFGNAGTARVSAEDQIETGQTHIKIETASHGLLRKFHAFNGEAKSIIDTQSGCLLMAQATTRSRSKRTSMNIVFDHIAHNAAYTDNLRPARNTTIPLPDGQPMEFITALIQARSWDPQPGDTRTIHVIFDNQIYPLELHAIGIEKTTTATSRSQDALLVIPKMPVNPRGIFRKGGQIRVWLARDENRLPVRFEVKVRVGTAVGLLTHYTPPSDQTRSPTIDQFNRLALESDDNDEPSAEQLQSVL